MSIEPTMREREARSEGVAAASAVWGLQALRERNERTRRLQAAQASSRANWIRRNRYYYQILKRLLKHLVEPGKRVLNIRC